MPARQKLDAIKSLNDLALCPIIGLYQKATLNVQEAAEWKFSANFWSKQLYNLQPQYEDG